MGKKFKLLVFLMVLVIILSIGGCRGSGNEKGENFPQRDFHASIMWSAGGVNDNVSRALGPFAEQELGKSIIFTNRPGAAGGISTKHVYQQEADGYNLLFGSENPQIGKVMETSDIDYSDFIPITLLSSGVGVLIVNPDSPYGKLEDLVEDMLKNPGRVKMSTTGPGGLPFTLASMMEKVNGIEAKMVVFDGEAEDITAVMGGHVDYSIVTYGSCSELIRGGKLKALALFHNESIDRFKDGLDQVAVITQIYPDYDKYLPWGSFHGVFVKEGTDEEIVNFLTEKFTRAAKNHEYEELLWELGNIPLAISGQEARDYVDNFRSISSWLMYHVGATKISPEEFGIKELN